MRHATGSRATCGNSRMTCPATSACRCVGTRIARPGEARSGGHKLPRRWCNPGSSHDPWVRCYAQKLIEYSPRGVPCIRLRALALQSAATRDMELGVNIGGINSTLVSTASTNALPSLGRGRRGRRCRQVRRRCGTSAGESDFLPLALRERSNRRKAPTSTSSDIVRPCRAASRLRSAMTLSSMLRVVFIS